MKKHILTRRTFLKVTGGSACSIALPSSTYFNRRVPALQSQNPEVVVIGAGAFGGWTALYLREMGLSVALIDAYGPGNARAASGGETRQIRAGYGEREIYTRWVLEAFKRWDARQEEWGGLPLFYRTGQLSLQRQWSRNLRATQSVLNKLGVENEVIEHDELARRYPQFNLDDIAFGHYTPSTGVLMARRGCFAVAQDFERKGGQFVLAKAKPGRQSGRQLQEVTLSTGQTIAAENFVFACGPWLPKVLPNPMKDRLVTPRRSTFWYGVPADDDRFSYPNCPNFGMASVYGFPSIEGRGLKFATVYDSIPFDADTDERLVTENEVERAREFLHQWFPALHDQPLLESRVCQYETSVDAHFIVDHHPDFDNVWLAGGGSAESFKQGPVLGEYIARRVMALDNAPELAEGFRLSEEEFGQPRP